MSKEEDFLVYITQLIKFLENRKKLIWAKSVKNLLNDNILLSTQLEELRSSINEQEKRNTEQGS